MAEIQSILIASHLVYNTNRVLQPRNHQTQAASTKNLANRDVSARKDMWNLKKIRYASHAAYARSTAILKNVWLGIKDNNKND